MIFDIGCEDGQSARAIDVVVFISDISLGRQSR